MSVNLDVSSRKLTLFCERWRVVELTPFGSALRDDFGSESDVDVLVRFRPDVMRRYAGAVAMERELADLVGRDVERTDYRSVVDWNEKYTRRKTILESAQVIYSASGGRG